MARKCSRDQEAICAYIRHFRDEFRKKGILHSAFARMMGISTRYLIFICNFDKDDGGYMPSYQTLEGHRKKLEELLKYHELENSDYTPLFFA